MKKLAILFIIILLISGCTLESINSIRVKYPEHKIYRISHDEYIAIKGDEIIYIETDLGVVQSDQVLKEVIGYKEVY